MRIRVKICGITTPEAATAASEAGADAVGFVFADSPRRVEIAQALRLDERLDPLVTRVAVFHYPDEAEVRAVMRELRPDVVQAEPTGAVLRATRGRSRLLAVLHDTADLRSAVHRLRGNARPAAIILEAPGRGGSGRSPDWNRARRLASMNPLVLAGGLTVDNVARAIQAVRPHAVDVSSGVELRPGIKDPERIVSFISAVRATESRAREFGARRPLEAS